MEEGSIFPDLLLGHCIPAGVAVYVYMEALQHKAYSVFPQLPVL